MKKYKKNYKYVKKVKNSKAFDIFLVISLHKNAKKIRDI